VSSLYRKWRSRSFDDLLGQEHVVRTLRNAVAQHRVGHAYLFTGPRGTGKTSTARILAKAVNCLTPRDGNACNECEMCRAAEEGRALDVIEIDAASNTSVDNVRELRERVAYAAGEGRYKVYIVDEVHRLSGAAFDAFLKTLEEPPEHVIFVFASTEPHKVPATIMSRCQRFDFHRISPAVTEERLRYVAGQEHIEVSDDALRIIAQAASGSLRDALGLLDQAAAYAEAAIEAEDVRRALGLTDPLLVARLTDFLIENRVSDGLREIATFLDAGGDPGQLIRQLVVYWRALLMRGSGDRDGAEIDPALRESVDRHGGRVSTAQTVSVLHALTGQGFSPKFNLPPELPLEVGFVEAALALHATQSPPAHSRSAPAPQGTSAPAPGNAARNSPEPPRMPAPTGIPTRPAGPAVTSDDRPPASNPAPAERADLDDLDSAWRVIVKNMRVHSKSIEPVLRSGYLMNAADGQLTVGFLQEIFCQMFADVRKRRLVEEVVQQTLGSAYRVNFVRVSKEEVEAARGEVLIDDGFVEEATERLREIHIRRLGNGHS
jgi:DNA polymerase-3 subunit gamma/tau